MGAGSVYHHNNFGQKGYNVKNQTRLRTYRGRAAVLIATLCLTACAHKFDRPSGDANPTFERSAGEIFSQVLKNHGGDEIERLKDVNVSLSGQWRSLIKRIQPLVTDFEYRIDSEERLLLKDGVYSALFTGPGGSKKVVRTRESIRVFYNDDESFDDDVLQSSALTADAFYYFLLGPLALVKNSDDFVRLADSRENGRDYHRLYTVLEPGFGFSPKDELILWIDAQTNTAHRMAITLEGYKSTKGAHVDVTFLEFENVNGFLLPVSFHERVRAPIAIHAHSWKLTGLDINRGIALDDVDGSDWQRAAEMRALPR